MFDERSGKCKSEDKKKGRKKWIRMKKMACNLLDFSTFYYSQVLKWCWFCLLFVVVVLAVRLNSPRAIQQIFSSPFCLISLPFVSLKSGRLFTLPLSHTAIFVMVFNKWDSVPFGIESSFSVTNVSHKQLKKAPEYRVHQNRKKKVIINHILPLRRSVCFCLDANKFSWEHFRFRIHWLI